MTGPYRPTDIGNVTFDQKSPYFEKITKNVFCRFLFFVQNKLKNKQKF